MLTEKKKNTVQTVEKNTSKKASQNSLSNVEKEDEAQHTADSQTPVPEPQVLIPIPKITESQRKQAKALGFDIGGLIDGLNRVNVWAETVEQRFVIMQEEMPQKTADALMKIADERRQAEIKKVQGNQSQDSSKGGLGGDVMGMLRELMKGGGSADSEMASLGKDLVRAQIESIKASAIARQEEGTILSKIGKEVLTRMVSKSVKEAVKE